MSDQDHAGLSLKDRIISYAATVLLLAVMLGVVAILAYGMTRTGPDDRDRVVRSPDLERQDAEWEWYERDPLTRGG